MCIRDRTLSDRIAVMSGGKVLQVDTPAGLYEAPRTRAVASFIGNMNFFHGTVRRNGSAMAAIEAEGLGTIPMATAQLTKPDGAPLHIGLRPEKFSLSPTRPEAGLAVEGRLRTAAYMGERSQYYLSIPGKAEPVAVSAPNTDRRMGADDLPEGQALWLSWSPEAIVILDTD